MYTKGNKTSLDQKLFIRLVFANAFILVFDSLTWVINGTHFMGARVMNIVVNIVYFLSNPIACMMYLFYTDYKLYEDEDRLLKRRIWYSLPFAANAVVILTSQWTGWNFYVDADNRYHRGPYLAVLSLISFGYLFYGTLLVLHKMRKNIHHEEKRDCRFLLLFPLLPAVCGIGQILFYGISIIWIGTAISLLMVYINVQNTQLSTDFLTGLYNRRRFDEYISSKIENISEGKLLFMVLIDVNHFKKVNDTYGHVNGDRCLVHISQILRSACQEQNDFVARLGGDEFVIVGERRNQKAICQLIQEVEAETDRFNQKKITPYVISLSCGFAIYGRNGVNSVEKLYNNADKKMYENKVIKKSHIGYLDS